IPISRQLGYEMREFFIEISIKDAIVLKDENVGSSILSSCLEHRQMALQATIVARGIRPCIGNLHFQAVCSREPLYGDDAMLSKPLLHSLPALGPSLQINTYFVGKETVQVSDLILLAFHSSPFASPRASAVV